MKYPVLYFNERQGVYRHSSIVPTLHLSVIAPSDWLKEEPMLREAYRKQLLQEANQAVAAQFSIACALPITNEDDTCIVFQTNLDQRQLKAFLQHLTDELCLRSEQADMELEYSLFQTMVMIKGKQCGFLHAAKEGEALARTNTVSEHAKRLQNGHGAIRSNSFTTLTAFRHIYEAK